MSKEPLEPSSVVLLVEDEALLRMHAADLLEEAGYEVVEARNSDEALQVMRAKPDVRVLFTDIQMPGPLDGMELARQVHENWPKVLLLITSGNLRPATADIPDHGHFLPKPYRAKEVVEELGALVREAAAR